MADKESTIKTIFALDGETKYKDAIKGISAEQRELQSELKKADAAYKLNGDKVEYNKSKVEILNKQYDLQKKKVDETKHAMEQSIKVHGENSAETQKLRTEYNKAETQLMKYEKQLHDATAELAKQVFPACAGVIQRSTRLSTRWSSVPRMRGGDPGINAEQRELQRCSPHARG